MAMSGVVAVAEPAFWAGFDRAYPETFLDYFRQISEFEPTRAAQYGIRHFCWVAVNPKEAENPPLSREVMRHMPEFFEKPTVLGVGEIGFHKTTKNEEAIFEEQLEMAIEHDQLVLIHTPHLQDKVRGTRRTLDVLRNMNIAPHRVWIDHVEEHTIREPLEAGYWVGFTLYPITKCSPKRAVDMLELYGHERILVNSSADWGPSDPFTLQSAFWNSDAADIRCRRRSRCSTTIRADSSGRIRNSTSSRFGCDNRDGDQPDLRTQTADHAIHLGSEVV